MSREHAPMSKPQRALLAEIEEAGVLYVHRYGRYDRTVRALAARGLVRCVSPDYSRLAMDGWSLAPDPGENSR